MSDESLDNLFKNGLSGRNVEFNMDSWRRMEQMLPPETAKGAFRIGTAAAVIGFLFVLSASIFIWSGFDSNDIGENMGHSASTELSSVSSNTQTEGKLSVQGNDGPVSSSLNESAINSTNSSDLGNDVNHAIESSESVTITGSASIVQQKGTQTSFTQNKSNTNNGFFADNGFSKPKRINNEVAYAKEEELVISQNFFTKISGVDELSTLSLTQEEDDHTIFAMMSKGDLPKQSKNELGFIGGVSLNESLVDNPNGGFSGSEFFGITYHRYFNGGISLKSNLLYSVRNEVNTRKMYDKKVYGFGSVTEQKMVETQRLVYLELPVMVNYGVGNHNFMAGASFSYLASCLNKVTTETTVQLESPTYEEKSEWGYTEAFNPYDFSVVAGYEYNLKPNLNVGLRLNYGLLDVTNNTYFGTDSFDNNVQLRVYLTYSPFRF